MKHSISILAVALLLSACAGGAITETTTPEAASTSAAETAEATGAVEASDAVPPVASDSPPPAAFEDITLTGTGKKVAKFAIPHGEAGIAIISYEGTSNFVVDSIAANGETNNRLVNTVGKYNGTVGFDLGDEEHSVAFEIDADGTWTIIIKPVAAAPVWDPATPLTGTGDEVYRVVPQSTVIIDLRYTGDDKFIVHAYNSDGPNGLANEIGNFTGRVWLPDDPFLLVVDADSGSWSVTPES